MLCHLRSYKHYLWLCTLFPLMKLPHPVPLTVNIISAILTFSTPWSALTLYHIRLWNKYWNNKIHKKIIQIHDWHTYKFIYSTEILIISWLNMANTNHETNSRINLTKNYSLVRPSKSSHSVQKKIKCSAGCVVACSIKVHNLNRGEID